MQKGKALPQSATQVRSTLSDHGSYGETRMGPKLPLAPKRGSVTLGRALTEVRFLMESVSVLARTSALAEGDFRVSLKCTAPLKHPQHSKHIRSYLNLLHSQIQEGVLVPHPDEAFGAFTTHACAQAAIEFHNHQLVQDRSNVIGQPSSLYLLVGLDL